ncbi:MAG: PQQ-binding-like beta-propeller repeat protein [Candidatus Thorarchaeota archaeon]|nr:PQQ-binding-like beta-propeller repeat protein [Candidatus Thorarchaeota archaeon]
MNNKKASIGILFIILASGLMTYLILGELPDPVVAPQQGVVNTWAYSTSSEIHSSAAIHDLDGDGIMETVIGSNDNSIYSINGEDGSLLWSYETLGVVTDSPVVGDIDDDNQPEVLVTGADGNLFVLNGEDGTRLWSPSGQFYYEGSLAFEGDLHRYSVDVGEDAISIHAILKCGSNDYDLYIGHEYEPSTDNYDYRGYSGEGEDMLLSNPEAGTWHFMVHSYSGAGAYQLTIDIRYSEETVEDVFNFQGSFEESGEEETSIVVITEGVSSIRSIMTCGSNDYDLYIALGYQPTTSSYDYRGYSSTGEDITIENPMAGDWYFMVRDHSGSGPYELEITIESTNEIISGVSGELSSSPTVADVTGDGVPEVIVGAEDGTLYCLNGGTGAVLWAHDTGYSIDVAPAVGDVSGNGIPDVIVVNEAGDVHAFEGDTGDWLWGFSMNTIPTASPCISDLNGDLIPEIIVVNTQGVVRSLHGNNGSLHWYIDTHNGISQSPALVDVDSDVNPDIILAFADGTLQAISGEYGSDLWEFEAGGNLQASPTIADVSGDAALEILIGNSLGTLLAISLDGTNIEWSFDLPEGISSSASVRDIDNDRSIDIIVGCDNGAVYRLSPSDAGQRIFWQGGYGASDFSRTQSMSYIDSDYDSLSYYSELIYGSSILNNDTDSDHIVDGLEVTLGLSPILQDSDFDSLDDFAETYIHHTSATNPDTDSDLLLDGSEINVYHTDPLNNDSDFDLLIDGLEIHYGSSPFDPDSDHDSIPDGTEVLIYGSSPSSNDTDLDMLSDYEEIIVNNTNANSTDTDNDLLSDYAELMIYFTDPLNPDSDFDSALDGVEVYELGTDVLIGDTDLDSYPDGWEAAFGFDPLSDVVPVQEPLFYLGPYLLGAFVVAIIGWGAYRWKREDRPKKDDYEPTIDTTQEPDTPPAPADIKYDLMDGVDKPWLYDGRESIMGAGGTHDFMQWLIQEESLAQTMINEGKHREAVERLEMLLKYVNKEVDLLSSRGDRTYLRTVQRLEDKIHKLRSTMN